MAPRPKHAKRATEIGDFHLFFWDLNVPGEKTKARPRETEQTAKGIS